MHIYHELEVQKLLEKKHIYFTDAYAGEIRCYKHEELIWIGQPNEVEACVRFFLEHGYIPNMM